MTTPGRAPRVSEIARINAEHLITTALRPADLLFVFGTREGVTERVGPYRAKGFIADWP
jgi:hypothetical protein